jgi:short-subunit dehydrogenase
MDYQRALITGASSGIGRGLAAWFARRKVKVWAAARRLEALEALKAEAGDDIVPVKLDVSDSDACAETVARLDRESGGFDLCVVNAGVGVDSSGKRLKWAPVKRMLEVNVLGATATICGVLPGMVERKRGHLVGISSVASFGGAPKLGAYCGTKAYLTTFLQGLRQDVGSLGITVSSIHPGWVKSEMTEGLKNLWLLMETEDAVSHIGKAIERGDVSYVFPWQLNVGMRALAALPRPLYEAAVRRIR